MPTAHPHRPSHVRQLLLHTAPIASSARRHLSESLTLPPVAQGFTPPRFQNACATGLPLHCCLPTAWLSPQGSTTCALLHTAPERCRYTLKLSIDPPFPEVPASLRFRCLPDRLAIGPKPSCVANVTPFQTSRWWDWIPTFTCCQGTAPFPAQARFRVAQPLARARGIGSKRTVPVLSARCSVASGFTRTTLQRLATRWRLVAKGDALIFPGLAAPARSRAHVAAMCRGGYSRFFSVSDAHPTCCAGTFSY
ncbi:MAG: hypothetical protein KER_01945 [Kerstersia gyiorum]